MHYVRQEALDRAVSEFIGICRGVLADGAICHQEAAFLRDWLARRPDLSGKFPFTRFAELLASFDPATDLPSDLESALLDASVQLVGGEQYHRGATSLPSSLPLCDPQPEISFDNTTFCMTGKFECGSRAEVEAVIEALGCACAKGPSRKVHYLVVGSVGSGDWAHSSFGRKIQRALELRAEGHSIAIISEEHWIDSVESRSLSASTSVSS